MKTQLGGLKSIGRQLILKEEIQQIATNRIN